MTSETIAILGVVGTFLVPFIVLYIDRYSENKIYIKLSSNRRKKIEGRWTGAFIGQPHDKINGMGVKMELTLKVGKRKIIGEGLVLREDYKHPNKLSIEGGFRNDRFLILNYNNPEVLQFGTMVFELKPTNDKLVGNLVGFGQRSETTIVGDVTFEKADRITKNT